MLEQTHNIKLAESFKPITKNLEETKEATEKLEEVLQKPDSEDGNTQTPSEQCVTGTQPFRDAYGEK